MEGWDVPLQEPEVSPGESLCSGLRQEWAMGRVGVSHSCLQPCRCVRALRSLCDALLQSALLQSALPGLCAGQVGAPSPALGAERIEFQENGRPAVSCCIPVAGAALTSLSLARGVTVEPRRWGWVPAQWPWPGAGLPHRAGLWLPPAHRL